MITAREFLRRETRATLRWLIQGRGVIVLLMSVGLILGFQVWREVFQDSAGRLYQTLQAASVPWLAGFVLGTAYSVPQYLILYIPCLLRVRERMLRIIGPGYIEQISATPLRPRDVWPTVLIRAALPLLVCTGVTGGLGLFFTFTEPEVFDMLVRHMSASLGATARLRGATAAVFAVQTAFRVASSVALLVASVAVAVRFSQPHLRPVKMVALVVASQLAMGLALTVVDLMLLHFRMRGDSGPGDSGGITGLLLPPRHIIGILVASAVIHLAGRRMRRPDFFIEMLSRQSERTLRRDA